MTAVVVTGIEATLARSLATPENPEDAADDKPPMEPECLRTGYGPCHRCQREGLIWRYEIDPEHAKQLGCPCSCDGEICTDCVNGVGDSGDVVCGGIFTTAESCTWSMWLESNALPWLCAACWRIVTAQELEHVRELEAANPF